MISVDFEITVMSEDNGKQNPNESYTNKYQKHVACSYVYKLVCVDDVVYKLISSMIEESKICSDMMKKNLTKSL